MAYLKRVALLSEQALLSRRALWTNRNILKMSSFRGRRKTRVPGESLRKQVWTGNQMDIQRCDRESNPWLSGPRMEKILLHYLLPCIKPAFLLKNLEHVVFITLLLNKMCTMYFSFLPGNTSCTHSKHGIWCYQHSCSHWKQWFHCESMGYRQGILHSQLQGITGSSWVSATLIKFICFF